MTAQPCANCCPTGGRRNQSEINFIELCRTCSNSEKFRRTGASAANRNQLNKTSLVGGLPRTEHSRSMLSEREIRHFVTGTLLLAKVEPITTKTSILTH